MLSCSILVFVFGFCFSGLPKGRNYWGFLLGTYLVGLEDFFEFLWVLDCIGRTDLRPLVASCWCFSYSFHLEELGVQVFRFKWASFERDFEFPLYLAFYRCFVFE